MELNFNRILWQWPEPIFMLYYIERYAQTAVHITNAPYHYLINFSNSSKSQTKKNTQNCPKLWKIGPVCQWVPSVDVQILRQPWINKNKIGNKVDWQLKKNKSQLPMDLVADGIYMNDESDSIELATVHHTSQHHTQTIYYCTHIGENRSRCVARSTNFVHCIRYVEVVWRPGRVQQPLQCITRTALFVSVCLEYAHHLLRNCAWTVVIYLSRQAAPHIMFALIAPLTLIYNAKWAKW